MISFKIDIPSATKNSCNASYLRKKLKTAHKQVVEDSAQGANLIAPELDGYLKGSQVTNLLGDFNGVITWGGSIKYAQFRYWINNKNPQTKEYARKDAERNGQRRLDIYGKII